MLGRSFEQVQQELQHSGDSIEIQVERYNNINESQRRPTQFNCNIFAESADRSSPTTTTTAASNLASPRRRLPQAPVVVSRQNSRESERLSSLIVYRVQLKIKLHKNNLSVAIVSAERPSLLHDDIGHDQDTFIWIQLIVTSAQ